MNTIRTFWRNWGSQFRMSFIMLGLLVGFWLLYVYGLGMEAPMYPAAIIHIFWACAKVAVFMGVAWVMTITYFMRSSRDMQSLESVDEFSQYRVWSVILLALALCSLA